MVAHGPHDSRTHDYPLLPDQSALKVSCGSAVVFVVETPAMGLSYAVFDAFAGGGMMMKTVRSVSDSKGVRT